MKPIPLLLSALFLACASQTANAPASTPAAAVTPAPAPAPAPAPSPAPTPPKLRLGDAARPTSYAVQLTVVPTEESFHGVIDIQLSVKEPLPVLWLNANDITLDKIEAKAQGQTFSGKALSTPKDYVGIAFDKPLPAGASSLRLEYTGKLARKESAGVTKQQVNGDWYVFTHFEPIDARYAFPCFDEPSFKVPWQVTVKVKKGDVAFSNTPVESKEEGADGFVTYHFARTRPLPSYLIAFAAGPFERVDGGKAGMKGTPVGIITPRGMASRARYAAEVSGPILAALEEYFGIPYPYEKMDVIAVPYFGGAMEHPGLVTFFLAGALSKPEEESINFHRRYAGTATHEFAHQWFGDLVTTAWWDDLWLNEAFATWMTPKILEKLRPAWGEAEGRARGAVSARGADSLLSARRIRQPITSNDDMQNAFDGITYGKGAAVIAMFERWVGPEKFQKGVQRYMREHADGNATAPEFLAAISAEAGRDVAPAFSSFLDQAGVPEVTASLECGAGGAKLELSQRRYLPLGVERTPAVDAQRWQIPICARFGQGKTEGRACTLLTEAHGSLPLEVKGCPDWVLPNDGMAGYYATRLQGDLLPRLMAKGKLTAPERIGLLGDLRAQVGAGALTYGELLGYLPQMAKDANVHVTGLVLDILDGVRSSNLVPPAQRAQYAAFLEGLYGKRARALGFTEKKGEDEDTRLLRQGLISTLAEQADDPQLVAQARGLADKYLTDHSAVAPDLAGVVLSTAASHGDAGFFDRLEKAVRGEKDQAQRGRLLAAISQFRDPALVKRALALTLSEELDPRETSRILFGATFAPENRPLVYEFVKAHFDELVKRLPRDAGASFVFLGTGQCDESKVDEVTAFFSERAPRFTGGPRRLAQGLEGMKQCIAFKKAQGPSVEKFLQTAAHMPAVAGPK